MIHQYKLNGYNIVLDVYSGSVHLVDDLAYDVIEMFENSSREEIVSAPQAVRRGQHRSVHLPAEDHGAGLRGFRRLPDLNLQTDQLLSMAEV